ncbi:MAG: 2-amino-4-hydroxy-6-hydroxymethyldihydropteridine diphosphokinase [Porphyromonas sp.]|uniref:2-amino-4-hydroxy-6- hydroxymethyldihydropteridine diphosphokinase n=1 Tax=Porphyromonas sp. TaxID=1924944 RepID=UPI001A5F8C27|nr:2-amino-4-hydroxy-6-hydroxymethyldihydropteridine diphosphokinase [Porphyromonas sp.]MBL6453416.1 2-amino-4-hydroxy-6-hydroxymethyldihydropteridine diphosphokinase [Porphyromonas sp.]
MKNKAIVSIGSNEHRTTNVKEVMELLKKYFPTIRFSTPQLTDPVDMPEDAKPFLNLIALFETELDCEALDAKLKKLETKLGRDRDDDEEGVIPMDLDIIKWNDEVYKPQDMVRPYVVAGLDELDEL